MILFFMSLWLILVTYYYQKSLGSLFDEEVFSEIQKIASLFCIFFMQTMAY